MRERGCERGVSPRSRYEEEEEEEEEEKETAEKLRPWRRKSPRILGVC